MGWCHQFRFRCLGTKDYRLQPEKSTRPAHSGSSSRPHFRSTGIRRNCNACLKSESGGAVDLALIASGGDGRDSRRRAFGPRRSSKNFSCKEFWLQRTSAARNFGCKELRLQGTSAVKNLGYKSQSSLSSHPSWIETTPTFSSKGSSSGWGLTRTVTTRPRGEPLPDPPLPQWT